MATRPHASGEIVALKIAESPLGKPIPVIVTTEAQLRSLRSRQNRVPIFLVQQIPEPTVHAVPRLGTHLANLKHMRRSQPDGSGPFQQINLFASQPNHNRQKEYLEIFGLFIG
jgi:hypothetical protein